MGEPAKRWAGPPRWRLSVLAAAGLACMAQGACVAPPAPSLLDASSGVAGFVHDVEGLLAGDSPSRQELAAELGAGAVSADLDDDGHLDLFFVQSVGPDFLCWGDGTAQFDCAEAPWPDTPGPSFAASAADADADGRLDLVVVGLDSLRLLRNRGDRGFEDVTEAAGLTPRAGMGAALAWADVDGDGDLDLWVGWHAVDLVPLQAFIVDAPDQLWRNDGGTFALQPRLPWPGDGDGAVFLGAFRDFDDDGDPDLLQLNDLGGPLPHSALWENTGDGWVDRMDASGVGILDSPMGASVVDLDGDGLRDLLVSRIGRPRAFRGLGGFEFVEQLDWVEALPDGETWVSWSVVPFDLRGDGDPLVAIAYGPLPRPVEPEFEDPAWWSVQPDRILDPRAGVEMAVLPERSGSSRGLVVGDFDEDLAPDLLVVDLQGPPKLYLTRGARGARLVVDLWDPGSANPFAVGAVVTVQAGGRSFRQEVVAGGPGTFSDGGPTLYFGLGEARRVDGLTIRWPDGAVQQREAACVDCRLRLRR